MQNNWSNIFLLWLDTVRVNNLRIHESEMDRNISACFCSRGKVDAKYAGTNEDSRILCLRLVRILLQICFTFGKRVIQLLQNEFEHDRHFL